MALWLELLVGACVVGGAIFAFIGSLGLARFPDIFMRLHGPTKASTLGVGGIMIAAVIYFSATGPGISVRELLLALFLFMTAPVAAHMMTKAALHTAELDEAERKPE
jgi:multicomponent K+:H+ antiporter subunit G